MWSLKIFLLSVLIFLVLNIAGSSSDNSTSTNPPAEKKARGIECRYKGSKRWGTDSSGVTKQCCGKGECKLFERRKNEEDYICMVNSNERFDAVKSCCQSKGDYDGSPKELSGRTYKLAMKHPC